MKSPKTQRQRLRKLQAWFLAAGLLLAATMGAVLNGAAGGAAEEFPAWAAPKAMALKKISPVDTAQHEPNFLNNLDCTLTEYRLIIDKTMRTGCFTPTAFGLLDSDSGTVIFNGTDEAVPLLPYRPGQVLVPWPNALDMVALEAAATGGSYVSLYKNPLAVMQDQRDGLFRLAAKRLTAGPDLPLRDPAGKQLVVNPQTLAFSDSGYWLVAETLNGSFVRINLATLDMVAFAPAYAMQGSPALLKSQVAVSGDGCYVAIANDAAGSLKVYDLTACRGVAAGLQPLDCPAYDYFSFARQRIAGLTGVRHLRFVNDGLLSFEARTTDPAAGGVYELAPRESINSLINYLGLGDSYTSGEGAFDYLAGTDTADNVCHLSANSYPLLLTRALFGSGGHSAACSGAVINDVGSNSSGYRGQVRDGYSFEELQRSQTALLNSVMANFMPGYVAQQRFVRQYQPAVVTVSVGGDDIGFGDILAKCVMPHFKHPGDNTCYSAYEDRLELTNMIDRTVPRWTALFKELAAKAPGSRIYAIGYPQVAVADGHCAPNVRLSRGELEFAGELVDYLDDHIRQAAASAGAVYVDVSQALVGHRLCEAAGYDVAVNGLTAGGDFGALGINVIGRESYHPNALGQALMEQAILEQTRNFASPAGSFIGNTGRDILKAPKTGRNIHHVTPVRLTDGVIRAGGTFRIKAGGGIHGLRARTVYSIRLGGPEGLVIGTIVSNATGDVAADVSLPADTAPGGQTIDVTGENQAGEPVDLSQPVYVPVSGSDADSDGLPDADDSCPLAVNSGQDADGDGIDDVCDGQIVPPLAVGQGGGPGGNESSAGTGSMNPDRGPVTVVTSFAAGSIGVNPPAVEPGIQAPDLQPAGSAVKTPGTAVLKFATAPATTSRLRTQARAAAAGARLSFKPRVINWQPWALLPVLFWLLLLFGYGLSRLLERRRLAARLYQKPEFSITMDE